MINPQITRKTGAYQTEENCLSLDGVRPCTSGQLTKNFGKIFSVTNLKQMRQFYCVYSQDQIGQKVADQFRICQQQVQVVGFILVGHIILS